MSCFGGVIPDSMDGILYTVAEQGALTKIGGGTSVYAGKVRPRGSTIRDNGISNGSVEFLRMFDTMTDVVSQGQTRRGYMAAYLPIEHGDILEFLDIGADGNDIQGLMTGVTVSDAFMEKLQNGDKHAGKVWRKLIKARSEVGYPYIMFSDTANRLKPQVYKDLNMEINASNLCSEIMLPSSEDESFICVLSSMNLLHYDEWKGTDAVEILTKFLDAVVSEFIEKLDRVEDSKVNRYGFLDRVLKFAKNHRAIGLGVLGYHSYIQSKGWAWDSKETAKWNLEAFKLIQEKSYKASEELGERLGTVLGTNRRNTTTMAIAPTKSSSFILGQVSQGIEPLMSNYFVNNTANRISVYKNPALEARLQELDKDTPEVWESIGNMDGSVQHLEFLSQEDKDVFKTFKEINPYSIIDQAGIRQQFIDQGQSLNLISSPDLPLKERNAMLIHAWNMGVKSLYYNFSLSAAAEFARGKDGTVECSSCQA